MIKYFDGDEELSENDKYYLVLTHGNHILDDFKQVEFSDCCGVVLGTRKYYNRDKKICSKCKKDIGENNERKS